MAIRKNEIPFYLDFNTYVKTRKTRAARVPGPFTVETREGYLSCPDGYLALDSEGFPYPIAKDEFENIYELDPSDDDGE